LVAQAGRRTLVLEKSLCQPDRIVGELLQPGGYLMLKKMGLEDCTREIDAQEVYGYALFKGASAFNIHYPTEGYDKDVSGRSFHHGRYDTVAFSLCSFW
jgi:squalene monooxygenase